MGSTYTKVGKNWPGVYYFDSKTARYMGKPDRCFMICFRVDGKQRWETVGWKSQKITPQIASEIRTERTKKARLGEEVLTAKEAKAKRKRENRDLDFVSKAYFANRGGKEKNRKIDESRYDLHVSSVVGKKAVRLITELDLKRIEKAMKGKSKASIWGALELVRRITNFGARSGLCKPLPFKVRLPKRDNEKVRYMSEAQLKIWNKVLEKWEDRDVVRMLRLVMLTGVRRGEVFGLTDKRLDFEQHLIFLADPKGGTSVTIPMSDPVAILLKEQIASRNENQPESPYIFPGRGGVMRSTSAPANKVKEKVNKKLKEKKQPQLPSKWRVFHDLRHHFGVTLANSGEFSIEEISELLTHKSIDLTRRRYAQFLPEYKKKAADRAARVMGAA